jgi:DNA replication protein DnaC
VRAFNAAGIPAKYATKTLDGFEAPTQDLGSVKDKAIRYGRGFVVGEGRGLVWVGEPGTGKTHLMTAVIGYLTLQCGVSARFVDFFHLTARLRASYHDDEEETESDLLEPLVLVPVLAIDELGKGRGTAWELSIVDQLITRRYNAGRAILATSNYLPESLLGGGSGGRESRERLLESLEERIGRRSLSRLREMGEILVVRGNDYRARSGITAPPVAR